MDCTKITPASTTQNKQRVAVIGSGIAGLTTAYLLSKKHQVSVFEANDYIGGHTHTVAVEMAGETHFVDSGFIVCNDRNYPNFLRLMEKIGVTLQDTEMSFSVTNHQLNLEYNGHSLATLFAQKRNFLRPSFYRLIRDILHFNKVAKKRLTSDDETGATLNDYLDTMNMGELFRDNYLLPMVAAIWSCSVRQAGQFPLNLLLRFLDNHGLLSVSNRPQWHVLKGGSHAYIPALTAPFKDSLHLSTVVIKVRRQQDSSVEVITEKGSQLFDHVILACHSDQALKLLDQPTSAEQQVLGDIRYQMNEVILHSDTQLMPKRQLAWASWNFLVAQANDDALPCVTYSMNILQGISSAEPLLVSLNASDKIAAHKIIQRFQYAHPVFSTASALAQRRRQEICGVDNIHYCGAYWYNGFHEDGVRSALDVCERFGVSL